MSASRAFPAFARHIGIDYSGASTPTTSNEHLRVYRADGDRNPEEVRRPRTHWTRKGIAEWLVERLAEDVPTLVGIDHGFSFPLPYYETHGLSLDWPSFLDDFQRHWPTDDSDIWVRDVLRAEKGKGRERRGDKNWLRQTEKRTKTAKSVFDFDVKQGCVAFSTHAGIPWLRFIRQRLPDRVHFWPFDGWDIPAGRSAVAEVYPALWSHGFDRENRTPDQHDAFSVAAWLSRADREGRLAAVLNPNLAPGERQRGQIEGWILGVANETPRAVRVSKKPEAPRVAPVRVPRPAGPRTVKACPECGQEFRGGTWGGIDTHWNARHNAIMPYRDAWPIIKAGGRPVKPAR